MKTTLDTRPGGRQVASGRTGPRRSAWVGRLIGPALVLCVVALAGYRFVTAGSDGSAPPPPTTLEPGDRVAALEARVEGTNDGPGWLDLAREATRSAVRTGDPATYQLATRAVAEARRLNPRDARVVVVDGVLALSLHDFARAEKLGQQAQAAAPGDADALGVLVDAQVELGRYDEAEATLARMLDRRPGSAALSRASYLRELHGDLPSAITAMGQALSAATSPSERAALGGFLADLQLATGDVEGARESIDAAVAADPDRVPSQLSMARTRAAQGDVAGAVERLSAVVDRSPQPAAATLLGELQARLGRTGDAERSFAIVRANLALLASAGVTTDLEAALFEIDHGDPVRGLELARSAYAARHTVHTADALGWALTRNGDARAALPYVDESLRLGTRSAPILIHAARALAAASDGARASTTLTEAFDSSPWLAPSLIDDARALAARLHVALPVAWRTA
jgi:tetratricopeptide (TPR) repeat protein